MPRSALPATFEAQKYLCVTLRVDSWTVMRRVHFRDDVDDEGEILELHPLLQWDLVAVTWLVQQKEVRWLLGNAVIVFESGAKVRGRWLFGIKERPWLRSLVHSTTSHRRTQDISLLIWCVFAVWFVFITMIPEFGFPYFWICTGNLLAVVIMQYLAETPRPIDLDHLLRQLQHRQCVDEDTGGFPCVDCHMAVVVLLPAILHTQSVAVQVVFVMIVFYIALCKLLLATRFISQVLGSWLMGLTGILIGNHGHVVVQSYKLSRGYNTAAIVALLVLAMIVLGMWIENNDSSLMGIPKQDFVEVFTNILNSDSPKPALTSQAASTTPARVHQLPGHYTSASVHQRRSQNYRNINDDGDVEEIAGKRDSFYFLVRGMRARALAARQAP